jgi:DNA-directed RNA polymerase subunit A'
MLHYNPTAYEINALRFSAFSPEMIRKISKAKITVADTYDDDGYPIDGGLMDQALGVIDPGLRCKTCNGNSKQCPGHFGHIELVRPVIHPHYAKEILGILNSICLNCSSYVLDNKGGIIKELESKDEKEGKKNITEEEIKENKKARQKQRRKKDNEDKNCPYCGSPLKTVVLEKPTTFYVNDNELFPTQIKEILEKMSDDTVRKLGYDPTYVKPSWFVLTAILVPSVKMRPSITLETGEKSEDDLTHKLVEIIRVNSKLEANINAGAPQLIIEDLWKLLQYHVTTYFDNEMANTPPARHRSGRPLKTIAQRLKGKEGRFRYNLSGKRVNFSARTVISPDPQIMMNEVGVPKDIAEILTIPIPVTEWNIKYIKEHIEHDREPKIEYAIRKDGVRIKITEQSKERVLERLSVGWIVERRLKDGDIVLFNRQPSLHRISMMAHNVKIIPGKTFRINPLVVIPYNADFDGDEMNLHAIQTEEARVEALELLKVEKQILSPRHGRAIIKPNEDHITAMYMLTRDDTVLTKEQAARLLYVAGITTLPKPDLKDGLYSGKLIFSMLLPPKIDVKEKSKMGKDVIIVNSKMIQGTLDEKVLNQSILEQIFIKHGPEVTKNFLNNITKVSLEYLTMHGFSVSFKDYTLSDKAQQKLKQLFSQLDKEIENLINAYKNKTLEPAPGMSLKQTLENTIMSITSKYRDEIGTLVEEDLGKNNTSIVMAKIGSRGNILNAIQMSAFVGQQAIRNKRPYRGLYKRVLSTFKQNDIGARAKGFVYSSFSKGLEPDEFFMHSIGGRDSIVNKGIRTARSGYMQRRLINALQDLIVTESLSVKDAEGNLIQTTYGGDGRDPMLSGVSEFEESPREDDVDTASA